MKALIRVVTGVMAVIFRPIAAAGCAVWDWLVEYGYECLGVMGVIVLATSLFFALFFGICSLIDSVQPSQVACDPRRETHYSATIAKCPNCAETGQKVWQEKGKTWNELTSFKCDECGVYNEIHAFLLCRSCRTLELTTPEEDLVELHKRPYCKFHWWCGGGSPDLIIVEAVR